MQIPIQTKLPRLDLLAVDWRGRHFHLPYLYREGSGGPSILFVHGLGGAKENFYAAFQSPALADCTLVAFDQPGTGLAIFDQDAGLDVGALADMANSVADQLLPDPYFRAGASMGGLIKSKGRIIFVRADDIDWVETVGNYVRLHVGRQSHLMRETMCGMEAKLEPQKFVRIHRSRIVNIDRVKELQPWAKGEYVVIMRDGARLNMSRRYRERLHSF